MREHEVPTHVQAEDRVLLWFTFPQIVAITAVCALSYGAYRYAPVGPPEVRMAIAVLFGLAGIAMVVGKIGGRRLPLVAADLLKYRLGARVYAGPVSQLAEERAARAGAAGQVRPRPPAPDGEAVETHPPQDAQEEPQGPEPPRRSDALPTPHLVRQAAQARRARTAARSHGRDAGEQSPHAGQGRDGGRRCPTGGDGRHRPPGRPGSEPGGRALARRDRLRADRAGGGTADIRPGTHRLRPPRIAVTFRAATDVEIRVRAFGGSEGRSLRFWGAATLAQGRASTTTCPCTAPSRPSPCPGRTP